MAMTSDYLNAVADHGATLITYIGLVDETDTEITGGDPAYARKAVTWESSVAGLIRPDDDLLFDIPAGTTVGGWRGYSASTGGTNYGGEDVDQESFTGQGSYLLLADSTAIEHTSS